MHLKKSAAPLKVKKSLKKVRVHGYRNKRLGNTDSTQKKTEFNPSYGYGVFGKNAPKCAIRALLAHLCTFLLIAP